MNAQPSAREATDGRPAADSGPAFGPRVRPSSAPAPSLSEHQELNVRFFLAVLGRWWALLLPLTLLLTAVSGATVMYFFRPQYRAAAWLQIKDQQPFVAFQGQDPGNRSAAEKFLHTQVELMRSPLVLGRALGQPEVAQMEELAGRRDPVQWLATKGLVITTKGDSELLEIAFEGYDPQRAAHLVNAVVQSYFSLRKEKQSQQTQRVIDLLEDEQARRAAEISQLQQDIRNLQQHLITKDPALLTTGLGQENVILSDNPLKSIQQSLSRAEVDEKILAAQVIALEESLAQGSEVPQVLVERGVDEQPEVQELLARIQQKRILLTQIEAASRFGREDPSYRRAEKEIAQWQAAIDEIRQQSRPRVEREMETLASLERQQQLEMLRTQLETQKLVVQSMLSNYEQKVREAGRSGGQTLDLRFKQDQLEREQRVFDMISQRATQLKTELSAPSRVEPIQMALPPEVPIEVLPWKLLAAALLGSLVLPFAAVAAWERGACRVSSADQLRQQSTLPVVGEIAQLPARVSSIKPRRGRSRSYELGLFEESIDSLRTGLVLAHDKSVQVLAVASAVSGEGKSSVAAQLALSLARAGGLPTLLIDADLRSPDLHRVFQIERGPGLAEVLEGSIPLEDAIHQGWSEQLHLLPAGKLSCNPHQLVRAGTLQLILQQLRSQYRYIVIDTPPVLSASESLVVACQADGTLLCALRDVSREDHVRLTYHRLLAVGARPLGAVLSGVPSRQYARRYGGYACAG